MTLMYVAPCCSASAQFDAGATLPLPSALLILVTPRLSSKTIPSTILPILPVVDHLSPWRHAALLSTLTPVPLKEVAVFSH